MKDARTRVRQDPTRPCRWMARWSWPGVLRALLVLLWLGALPWSAAHAVPSFVRQTGQQCAACHAGGQYPELTPFGRMFKLTGYTLGERGNPLAAMVVLSDTRTQNNSDGSGGVQSQLDSAAIVDFASVFLAGKASDHVGGFAQYTQAFYDHRDSNNNNWQGRLAADNFDLRYADRSTRDGRDLIWGLTLHNNPTVQDVWNSTPAWGYPYVSTTHGAFGSLPAATQVEGRLAAQVAGLGIYAYLNESVYAELSSYQTAKGNFSFLSYGSQAGDSNHALTYLDGNGLYGRLAYTRAWADSNLMLGLVGLDVRTFPNDSSTYQPLTGGGSTHYVDTGVDAQYQYLGPAHTVTAHLRAMQERIDDASKQVYSDGAATLGTLMAKVSYVQNNRYGASLTYSSVRGSADSTAYSSSAALKPDSERWTPELFWMPLQNLRIGLQYNLFTRYLGASSNYDGKGRNASDNNTTYLYLWTAF